MPQIKDITRLPKPEKVALTRVMVDLHYPLREIADYLDVSYATITRWANSEIDDKNAELVYKNEKLFSQQMKLLKQSILMKAVTRINELLPKSKKIVDVVKAAEFLENKQTIANQTNFQVNFNDLRSKQKEKYGI